VADNILQSQRLGEEARKLIDAQRRRQAEKVVERFQWIGAGVVSVMPLPVVDLLATAAVNAQMVVEMAESTVVVNLERGRELALSLAKTWRVWELSGSDLLSTALQLNVATFVIGRAIKVTAAYLTHIAGKVLSTRHDQD